MNKHIIHILTWLHPHVYGKYFIVGIPNIWIQLSSTKKIYHPALYASLYMRRQMNLPKPLTEKHAQTNFFSKGVREGI